MEKIQMKQDNEKETQSEEGKDAFRGASHESLWGAILFACMLLFVIASIGGVGWVAYTKWQTERTAENQPSIAVLSGQTDEKSDTVSDESTPAADVVPAQEPSLKTDATAAKKLEISVLNGGATKGSAGVLADFLKKEGYIKTDAGNTVKDYTGIVVYYAAGLEKEAATIKESVAKKYPQAKTLPADTGNKETSASQVTIILGK